ncbi:MAG: DUF3465 domain-containing protein [Methylophilaceae bacterium]
MLHRIVLILLIALFCSSCKQSVSQFQATPEASIDAASQPANATIEQAFKQRKSNLEVEGKGIVTKILADDNNGLKHQKFLVKVSPEQTLLFAHNLDLSPRINQLAIGDTIEFKGEYVYNPKGGIVHWTHKDPKGEHDAGWIKHNGKMYE